MEGVVTRGTWSEIAKGYAVMLLVDMCVFRSIHKA